MSFRTLCSHPLAVFRTFTGAADAVAVRRPIGIFRCVLMAMSAVGESAARSSFRHSVPAALRSHPFSAPRETARFTGPFAVIQVGVLRRVFMASRAMRLVGVNGRDALSSQGIQPLGDWLQMTRVNAIRVTTQMIKRQTVFYWAFVHQIHQAIDRNTEVASVVSSRSSLPQPFAFGRLFDLVKEHLLQRVHGSLLSLSLGESIAQGV